MTNTASLVTVSVFDYEEDAWLVLSSNPADGFDLNTASLSHAEMGCDPGTWFKIALLDVAGV